MKYYFTTKETKISLPEPNKTFRCTFQFTRNAMNGNGLPFNNSTMKKHRQIRNVGDMVSFKS